MGWTLTPLTCPNCGTDITPVLRESCARGGRAGTGKAKARTKSQARAAAMRRWEIAREKARVMVDKALAAETPVLEQS